MIGDSEVLCLAFVFGISKVMSGLWRGAGIGAPHPSLLAPLLESWVAPGCSDIGPVLLSTVACSTH